MIVESPRFTKKQHLIIYQFLFHVSGPYPHDLFFDSWFWHIPGKVTDASAQHVSVTEAAVSYQLGFKPRDGPLIIAIWPCKRDSDTCAD